MADMTCAIALMGLISASMPQQGTVLPARPLATFKVTEVRGAAAAIPSKNAKATVLLFVGTDCPIANRMAPEIARIIKDYKGKGVECWMVYPNKDLKAKEVIEHMKAYDLECKATIDAKHALVKSLRATVTPQAAILDSKRMVRYLGRINDLYAEHGRTNPAPKVNDLRDALDSILAGRSVKNPITEAIGCYIGE